MRCFFVAPLVLAALLTCASALGADTPGLPELQAMTARFAPVDIRVDLSGLPGNERQVVTRLVQASEIIDGIYLRQTFPLNTSLLLDLTRDRSPLGEARLHYFRINKGPWSELDEDKPFLPGISERPPFANFYPADATREEVERWIKSLGDKERIAATGFFTTIRRTPEGTLTTVPYTIEYQGELQHAAKLLHEAAALTKQPTLQSFLEKRAKAFLTNDYYDSDMAWMELNASIEPTIGPYEVYEDEWFNYKAAFESFVTVTDVAETEKLARFGKELQGLEDRLPIDPQYRRKKLGGLAPIRVVNVVYSAGDGNHGIQTAAFNLPNDERVVAAKGSKRVMLHNFQQAKFEKVLLPLSKLTLAAPDQPLVSFEPFFTHILMHELMHGLGPQTIKVGGRETTVRQELKELNGLLEEAKADISGLWALQTLMDKGVLDKKQEKAMYVTFLASSFRTLRFGLNESHAKGMALQVNYLLDRGAVIRNADGTFRVDVAKAKKATEGLTREIMTIQAHGDYAAAQALVKRMVVIRPEIQQAIDRTTSAPIDIEPRFVTADELVRQ
jgi:Peptidase family M49